MWEVGAVPVSLLGMWERFGSEDGGVGSKAKAERSAERADRGVFKPS